jgi:hypothetical protein
MYCLHKNGLFKAVLYDEAMNLIKEGWHDVTRYQSNQEVLTYDERKQESCEGTSSEWQEPRYQQCDSNFRDRQREECEPEAIRSGTPVSEISRKRGRPKKVSK